MELTDKVLSVSPVGSGFSVAAVERTVREALIDRARWAGSEALATSSEVYTRRRAREAAQYAAAALGHRPVESWMLD